MFPIRILSLILALSISIALLPKNHAQAAVSDWVKSASITPRNQTDFASDDFKSSLMDLANTGANYVTLIIQTSQPSGSSSVIENYYNTPTDESLIQGISYAHMLGLKVNLKFHHEAAGVVWRAKISPTDRASWYAAYKTMLSHYAEIARLYNVEMMTIGTELINVASSYVNSENEQAWRDIIQSLRIIYPGKLTYSANWGPSGWNYELGNIKFWDALDYIGISAYYPLSSSVNSYTSDSLLSRWASWNASNIKPIQQKYSKPVLFTEVGYRSVDGSLVRPPNWQLVGPVDEQEQADGYTALYEYWKTQPFMAGVDWWDWEPKSSAGGSSDTGFTPQGKKALEIMTAWNKNNAAPANSPLPNQISTSGYLSDLKWASATNGWGPVELDKSNGETSLGDGRTLTINGKTYAKGLGVHAKSKIIYNLKDCTKFTSDIGVDDEVSIKGSVVFDIWVNDQKVYSSGLMTVDTPAKQISIDLSGAYKLAIIANDGGNGNAKDHADWANALIECANSPLPVPPPTPDPTPPPTPSPLARIDVWWPQDQSWIAGVLPFKALVSERLLPDYEMFWQVDGDRLNPMYDTNEGGSHKEAWVDVAGWTWRQNGPYKITFVAKDKSGATIATRDIQIYAVH